MQVENFECQIAQAQIGNFLSGSGLSDDAMQQLEEHIAGCADCKAALAEKRNELKAMLTQERVAVDASEIFRETEEQKSAKTIAAALRKKTIRQLTEAQTTAVTAQPLPTPTPAPVAEVPAAKGKSASYWKPLGYSMALGAVLVGMSLFANNLSSIFGPRANDTKNAVASVTPPVTTASTKVPATTTTGTTTPATTTPATTTPVTSTSKVETPTDTTPNEVSTTGSLGATAGALATTQFASANSDTTPVTTPPTKAVEKPAAKPQAPATTKPAVTPKPTKAAVTKPTTPAKPAIKPVVKRRPTHKRVVRRVKAHAPRKHGITIYQP